MFILIQNPSLSEAHTKAWLFNKSQPEHLLGSCFASIRNRSIHLMGIFHFILGRVYILLINRWWQFKRTFCPPCSREWHRIGLWEYKFVNVEVFSVQNLVIVHTYSVSNFVWNGCRNSGLRFFLLLSDSFGCIFGLWDW